MQKGDWPWVSLLRVQSGTNVSVFDLWTSGESHISGGVYCNGAVIAQKWSRASKVSTTRDIRMYGILITSYLL